MRVLTITAPLLCLMACHPNKKAQETSAPQSEASSSFYKADRVVKVELSGQSFEDLRKQEPKGGHCVWGYPGSQYDWFKMSEIKVDGVSIKDIGAKKKSWCNSESKTKPSMNINFGKYQEANDAVASQNWGTESLILNNSIQDDSYVRQCLSYELFEKAGIPSPHCNFAHLSVNGQDFGVYVNLEPMKKAFIKQRFGEPLGNLYEVGGEAFENWALARFKINLEGWATEDLKDIQSVIDAIRNDQSDELSSLQKVVDFDSFLSYWAMEIILTHWDGMTLGTNNSYIYFKEGKLRMLPWGTDQILARNGKREVGQIYADNNLAKKIAQSKTWRPKLEARIAELMNTVWKESEVLARVEQMAGQVRPHVLSGQKGAFEKSLSNLKNNISNRRREISSFIALGQSPAAPGPAVASGAEQSFPKCERGGFTEGSASFTYLSGTAGWGYMKLNQGAGFSCRIKSDGSANKLPFCSQACPTDGQSAADWGWCSTATGFSCQD